MKYLIVSLFAMWTTSLHAFQLYEETFLDEYDESRQHVGEDLARLTFADKDTYLTHEGREEDRAIRNMPVVSGDILKTFSSTYAEIEFIDGSLMQFADRTEVEFQAINEIYDSESLNVIKLHSGSVFLHVTEEFYQADRRVFRVDTSSGPAYIEAPGIYRVDKMGSRMTLKAYRGFAELSGEADSVDVYSGEYADIRNMYRPHQAKPFNSFQSDHFESWAYERRPETDSISAKYVDKDIASYSADLDDHGEWRYEDNLDRHVWVPFVESSLAALQCRVLAALRLKPDLDLPRPLRLGYAPLRSLGMARGHRLVLDSGPLLFTRLGRMDQLQQLRGLVPARLLESSVLLLPEPPQHHHRQ